MSYVCVFGVRHYIKAYECGNVYRASREGILFQRSFKFSHKYICVRTEFPKVFHFCPGAWPTKRSCK